jgi:prolyl oligopeptidase PreP (S9A serine peptidase family)
LDASSSCAQALAYFYFEEELARRLTAKLLTKAQGGFEVLNLPAIAQRNETYFLGDGRTYDRQKGELLHACR